MDRLHFQASVDPVCEVHLRGMPAEDLVPVQTPTARERIARIVRTLESDIIPRLVCAHQPTNIARGAGIGTQVIAPSELDSFLGMVLGVDHSWDGMVRGLLVRGVSVETIYLQLLTPAARELGRRWDDDTCDFSQVTVAVGRLQQIMRSLSPAFGSEVAHPADGRRVLLVPAPGEQHTFGLAIVAEFFRREGWEVLGGAGDHTLDPVTAVRNEWLDVIGISVGVEARLDWLKTAITAIRKASRNKGIGVMVGGPIFVAHPERADEVGADALAPDGREAPHMAEQLLDSRARRV